MTETEKPTIERLIGPISNHNNEVRKGEFFAARAISTFPQGDAEESNVDGGDIVDMWGLDIGYLLNNYYITFSNWKLNFSQAKLFGMLNRRRYWMGLNTS